MKKLLLAGTLVAAVVVVVLLLGGGSSDKGYLVRAIFDNGGFLVKDEEVRVAGANVGTIKEVDVTMPGETVAYRDGEPVAKAGKAVVVLEITEPGFQDFRQDASCQIRPQSLIGEKFVDCRTTLPRAPGTPPPPPLEELPDGQPGAGEHLLPLGSNGTSIDPDLINDIQTLPYAQRFRLIFNELGAGFAGRGEDLEELVKRANPVLRDVDRLFGILSKQRNQLAQLSADSDAILGPLSEEREHFAGFFTNSGAAAEASAEKGEQLEESFSKFPTFLREFRLTMRDLGAFSEAATPVFEGFDEATPALTDATRTLTPFNEATTVSLKSLGQAGEEAGPLFVDAEPVIEKAGTLAKSGVSPTTDLAKLFVSLRKTKGWEGLVELIYNSAASLNGFDQWGHFGRTRVTLSTCLEYVGTPGGTQGGGCAARFNGPGVAEEGSISAVELFRLMQEELGESNGGTSAESGPTAGIGQADSAEPEAELGEASSASAGTEPLLDYLLGP
jgi:phospholipid/cholesterol/gamma-HCH transport system substrate-binding protein